MATIYADPDIPASGPLAQSRSLDDCLRALKTCGWERLAPLAQHMANKRLVRARGDIGAPLRRLDVHTLRGALSRMLCQEWEDGYLIYQLVVESAEPAQVAAERGVSRATLVEQLRDAVGALAIRYERLANGDLNDSSAIDLRAALGSKRG
jgi:hypothetical protein